MRLLPIPANNAAINVKTSDTLLLSDINPKYVSK
jgi:hypothetical protein